MSERLPKIFCTIVTFHSRAHITECLRNILAQKGIEISVFVIDQSRDDSVADLMASFPKVEFVQNDVNLGFCGAHNQGVARFLKSDCEALLILNPDLALEPQAIARMFSKLDSNQKIGMVTPLLLRAYDNLKPCDPRIIDAAGMELNLSLRHLDRGADQPYNEDLAKGEIVFGGTGAALLLSRDCIEGLLIENQSHESDVDLIYPQLKPGRSSRRLLFDEAFFAYREDAELAWRARRLGWRCWFEPSAIGFHVRRVTPERRAMLPAQINMCSVRNRYLMQVNNLSIEDGLLSWIVGAVVRNVLVFFGVLFCERSSLVAFKHLWQLWPRALERRRSLSANMKRG